MKKFIATYEGYIYKEFEILAIDETDADKQFMDKMLGKNKYNVSDDDVLSTSLKLDYVCEINDNQDNSDFKEEYFRGVNDGYEKGHALGMLAVRNSNIRYEVIKNSKYNKSSQTYQMGYSLSFEDGYDDALEEADNELYGYEAIDADDQTTE